VLRDGAFEGPRRVMQGGAQLVLREATTQCTFWRSAAAGPGTLDGVTGTLTITGKTDVLNPDGRTHKIHLKWTAGKRLVAGCSYEEVLHPPVRQAALGRQRPDHRDQ
jgi:hypothetical protein